MLPQKYTVPFFVSFYKQESDVQDHDDPQVLKGVLKCTHSFTEWTLGDVYYVPDTVPFTSVCCFVWSSHYPHLTDEKTRGSERLNDLSKFRKPDSGRTGFWTSVWFQSSCTDSFNAPCCLPWQKSLTSYYGAGDSWEWCYLHCRAPGWRRFQLRQRAIPGPLGILCSALSACMTMERREGSSRGQTHHHQAKARSTGTTRASPGVTLMSISRDPKCDETFILESKSWI